LVPNSLIKKLKILIVYGENGTLVKNILIPPPPPPSRVDKEEALNLVTEYCDYCPFFQYLVREAVESVF